MLTVHSTLLFVPLMILYFVCNRFFYVGNNNIQVATVGSSTNIAWHKCSVEKRDREELLNQKGCVIWITGLSGSGF